VGVEVADVGIQEDEDVADRLVDGPAQGLPLAVRSVARSPPDHPGPGRTRLCRGGIAGAVVDHEDLVDERHLVDERRHDAADDGTHGRRLVPSGQAHRDPAPRLGSGEGTGSELAGGEGPHAHRRTLSQDRLVLAWAPAGQDLDGADRP
jgi:hypothetical protein